MNQQDGRHTVSPEHLPPPPPLLKHGVQGRFPSDANCRFAHPDLLRQPACNQPRPTTNQQAFPRPPISEPVPGQRLTAPPPTFKQHLQNIIKNNLRNTPCSRTQSDLPSPSGTYMMDSLLSQTAQVPSLHQQSRNPSVNNSYSNHSHPQTYISTTQQPQNSAMNSSQSREGNRPVAATNPGMSQYYKNIMREKARLQAALGVAETQAMDRSFGPTSSNVQGPADYMQSSTRPANPTSSHSTQSGGFDPINNASTLQGFAPKTAARISVNQPHLTSSQQPSAMPYNQSGYPGASVPHSGSSSSSHGYHGASVQYSGSNSSSHGYPGANVPHSGSSGSTPGYPGASVPHSGSSGSTHGYPGASIPHSGSSGSTHGYPGASIPHSSSSSRSHGYHNASVPQSGSSSSQMSTPFNQQSGTSFQSTQQATHLSNIYRNPQNVANPHSYPYPNSMPSVSAKSMQEQNSFRPSIPMSNLQRASFPVNAGGEFQRQGASARNTNIRQESNTSWTGPRQGQPTFTRPPSSMINPSPVHGRGLNPNFSNPPAYTPRHQAVPVNSSCMYSQQSAVPQRTTYSQRDNVGQSAPHLRNLGEFNQHDPSQRRDVAEAVALPCNLLPSEPITEPCDIERSNIQKAFCLPERVTDGDNEKSVADDVAVLGRWYSNPEPEQVPAATPTPAVDTSGSDLTRTRALSGSALDRHVDSRRDLDLCGGDAFLRRPRSPKGIEAESTNVPGSEQAVQPENEATSHQSFLSGNIHQRTGATSLDSAPLFAKDVEDVKPEIVQFTTAAAASVARPTMIVKTSPGRDVPVHNTEFTMHPDPPLARADTLSENATIENCVPGVATSTIESGSNNDRDEQQMEVESETAEEIHKGGRKRRQDDGDNVNDKDYVPPGKRGRGGSRGRRRGGRRGRGSSRGNKRVNLIPYIGQPAKVSSPVRGPGQGTRGRVSRGRGRGRGRGRARGRGVSAPIPATSEASPVTENLEEMVSDNPEKAYTILTTAPETELKNKTVSLKCLRTALCKYFEGKGGNTSQDSDSLADIADVEIDVDEVVPAFNPDTGKDACEGTGVGTSGPGTDAVFDDAHIADEASTDVVDEVAAEMETDLSEGNLDSGEGTQNLGDGNLDSSVGNQDLGEENPDSEGSDRITDDIDHNKDTVDVNQGVSKTQHDEENLCSDPKDGEVINKEETSCVNENSVKKDDQTTPKVVNTYVLSDTHQMTWIRFHGKVVTSLKLQHGNFVILKEIIKRCFRINDENKESKVQKRQAILIIKRNVLKIPDRWLDQTFYPYVDKSLRDRGVMKAVPRKMSIVSEAEANQLFHHVLKDQFCSEGCVAPYFTSETANKKDSKKAVQEALNNSSKSETVKAQRNVFEFVEKTFSPSESPSKLATDGLGLCSPQNSEDGYTSDSTFPFVDGKPGDRLKELETEMSANGEKAGDEFNSNKLACSDEDCKTDVEIAIQEGDVEPFMENSDDTADDVILIEDDYNDDVIVIDDSQDDYEDEFVNEKTEDIKTKDIKGKLSKKPLDRQTDNVVELADSSPAATPDVVLIDEEDESMIEKDEQIALSSSEIEENTNELSVDDINPVEKRLVAECPVDRDHDDETVLVIDEDKADTDIDVDELGESDVPLLLPQIDLTENGKKFLDEEKSLNKLISEANKAPTWKLSSLYEKLIDMDQYNEWTLELLDGYEPITNDGEGDSLMQLKKLPLAEKIVR